MGVLNYSYHSESTFEIGSLCNSIVHQIWHCVLISKFLIFSFNTFRLLLQILASRFNLTDLSNVFLFNEWYHKVALYIFLGKTQIQVAFRWGNLWSLQWWSLRRRGKPWRPEGNLQYWFNDYERLQFYIYRFWDHCCQMILNTPTDAINRTWECKLAERQ